MADAHSAVAFSFSISHDGIHVNYDQELLSNIYTSVSNSYKRRISRLIVQLLNNFNSGIFPMTPETLWLSVLVFLVGYYGGVPLDRGGIAWFLDFWALSWLPLMIREPIAVFLFGFLNWFTLLELLRYGIKGLLEYKGYLTEPRGKPSLRTKCWSFLVKHLSLYKPRLNSYQGSLPRLPLPSLTDTLDKHLKSMRPLLSDEEFEEIRQFSYDFRNTLGPKCQYFLTLKTWFASNYVTDWWEHYVYLKSRAPIMVNSNFYGMDTVGEHVFKKQGARAANLVYASLLFRRQLARQEIPPIILNGVPLCSYQYTRLFNTTRIPGDRNDYLRCYQSTSHIAVFHKGAWYKLPIHNGLRLLNPAELQYSIQMILDMASDYTPTMGEERIGALTAGSRSNWATARHTYFNTGLNKNSLNTIESAAFVLCLDTEDEFYDPKEPGKLDHWAHTLLHGKGNDRWYDKSFNIIISANARAGFNTEHSWGDAPIMSQLFENIGAAEFHQLGYTRTGDVNGSVEKIPPSPKRLEWEISEECKAVIDVSFNEAKNLGATVDMAILVFKEYGKGFIKKINCSPDAFIQMALQCTFYQLEGKFPLTYEAAMARLFLEGRTETVRSLTADTAAFIRAFVHPTVTDKERLRLMLVASESHTLNYRESMTGQGVDRHLFALYVVSKYLEEDSPFLQKVVHMPWVLSTSQTATQQVPGVTDLVKNPELAMLGGGFGPVSDSGYGVSYIISGEGMISFHISSKTTCPGTDSSRFRDTLSDTLISFKRMATLAKA